MVETARFEPDSPCVTAVLPSPNHGERREGRRPDMLLLHYTGMPTAAAALARLCDPATDLSSHYVVDEDGRTLQLVPEARRAHHAGAGGWAGERDINSLSIGIEIVNAGHAGGLPPYPDAQIEAVIGLGRDIAERWSVAPTRVLAHSDIAPSRKEDPGERFPWHRLAAAGLGHWVAPDPLSDGRDDEEPVEALQAMLASYGYDLSTTGRLDEVTVAVVTAFQRHFRQARVDGVPDASTTSTLRRLLAACQAPDP